MSVFGYEPVPTRLTLPSPSICPPPRKKASMRPCAAQSKSSTPPLVKKLLRVDPSTDARSSPRERARARSTAAPGMGEAAPTATCRQPARSPAITKISNSWRVCDISSVTASCSFGCHRGLLEPTCQELGKALVRLGEPRIATKESFVLAIAAPEAERPRARSRQSNAGDVERRNDARREAFVLEEARLADLHDRHEALLRGMRHRHQLAMAPDADIALPIGERCMKQRDVGPDRGQRHDAVAGSEGVLDDLPIRAAREEVA